MRFILVIILMFGQRCFAQTSISIAPLIIGKAYFCSYPSDFRFNQLYSEQSSQYVPNPYYTFGAKKFSYRPSIDIGIQFELSLKNNKHRIGLEWASDASGTMSKTTDFATTNTYGVSVPYKTYGSGTSYFQSGFTYNRISLRYHYMLTNQNSIINLYFVPELTFTFGKSNSASWLFEIDTNTMNTTYFHNDAKSLSREINAYYNGQKSVLAGVGLRADVKTHKQKKYLFTLDISYKQGYKVISYSQHTTVLYDSGKVFGITDGLSATGSGLYLQISRYFTLHKWYSNQKEN